MVIYEWRDKIQQKEAVHRMVLPFLDMLGVNYTQSEGDDIIDEMIKKRLNWVNMEFSPLKYKIVESMADFIFNKRGNLNYEQGVKEPWRKSTGGTIRKEFTNSLSDGRCFWLTSSRLDDTDENYLWGWGGYLSWSLFNNGVKIWTGASEKEDSLLHIALSAPDDKGNQNLYFKMITSSKVAPQIPIPYTPSMMKLYGGANRVNWNNPIKFFFCEKRYSTFLNWDDSPFINQ